jgi:hypothetical protein
MWVTAWIIVVSSTVNQPNLPPVQTLEQCEEIRKVFHKKSNDNDSKCVMVKVLVNGK